MTMWERALGKCGTEMPLVGATRRRFSSTPSHQAMEIKTYNKSVSTEAFQSQNKKQLSCWKIRVCV